MTVAGRRVRRRTLTGRLALLGTAAAAFWVLAITVIFNLLVDTRLGVEVDGLVTSRAQAAAATVVVAATGRLSVLPGEDDALDVNVWIYDGTRLIEGVAGGVPTSLLPDLLGGGDQVVTAAPGTTRYAAVAIRGTDTEQVGTVIAAAPLLPFTGARRDILAASAALALLTLAGTYLALRLAVSRAIAPVTRMTGQAAQWSAQGSDNRFGDTTAYAELDTLGHNLDSLLARLSAVLHHEQRLTAELSHEMRTPLATLRAELELLAMRPRGSDEVQATAAELVGSVDRLTVIIETLLLAARGGTDPTPGVWRIDSIIESVVTGLNGRLGEIDVNVSVSPPGLCIGAPDDLAVRALSPIVDNALRYAATSITIVAHARGAETVVTVVNDGPTITPVASGVSGAEHGGAGLGLPLARRLARAVGGDVSTVPMDRGAAFEIRFPRGDA